MSPALKKAGFVPSKQQAAFFRWVANRPSKRARKKHCILRARAGTGKTTTAVRSLDYSMAKRIGFVAYNTTAAAELKSRITNPNAEALTFHALGRRLVKKAWGMGIRILEGNERARTLTARVVPADMHKTIQNTISYLHTRAREVLPLATSANDLLDLMWRFDIHVPEWAEDQWTDSQLAEYAYAAMDLAAQRSLVVGHGMDFADMIYLPVKCRLMQDLFDELFVDETQDMNAAQMTIAQGVCPNGRIILIGDDRQAIYSWRGADSDNIDRMKAQLDADELPLTITYRCGKAIVDLAKVYVPDFEAHESAPEGLVRYTRYDKMMAEIAPGDFLLSRSNAPLVKIAMALIRDGKKARIAGRDMNKGLLRLIEKLGGGVLTTVQEFAMGLTEWRAGQIAQYAESDTPERAQVAMDQADILTELADGCATMADVRARLETVFTDNGTGEDVIMCSTVHKAKGLERKRVFILSDTLQTGRNQEENNITYVAITRAKEELVFVEGK